MIRIRPITVLTSLVIVFVIGVGYGSRLHNLGVGYYFREWANHISNYKYQFLINSLNSDDSNVKTLSLNVSGPGLKELTNQRKLGKKFGQYYKTHPDNHGYVKASLEYNGDTLRIETKLKGIKEDHFGHYKKWSYKVKIKGDKTLFGMKQFALQHPRTRSYMIGWLFNELLAKLDIIHLRYSYVKLKFNGDDFGLYALEENMGRNLLEHQGYPNGPIVTFNTDYFFSDNPNRTKYYTSASIKCYNQSKIKADSQLSNAFLQARTLLESLRDGSITTHDVFEIKKLGRYYALMELMGYWHGGELYNMKFYYNTSTENLHPIGYDNDNIKDLETSSVANFKVGNKADTALHVWLYDLFKDPLFYSQYVKELEYLSTSSFLDDFFSSKKERLDSVLRVIHSSYPQYMYDSKEILLRNQNFIRKTLYDPFGYKSYFQVNEQNTLNVEVFNLVKMATHIVGVGSQKKILYPLDRVLQSASFPKLSNENIALQLDSTKAIPRNWFLYYKILGADSVIKVKGINHQRMDKTMFTDTLPND